MDLPKEYVWQGGLGHISMKVKDTKKVPVSHNALPIVRYIQFGRLDLKLKASSNFTLVFLIINAFLSLLQ